MEYRRKKLNEFLRGWCHYYCIFDYYRPIPRLDEWIRRRLRMCFWKEWKTPRNRVKNLLKLGCNLAQAKKTGASSKG
ncbi:group II intron maturase-specific domain-containing protein [Dissulfuribacter thermophilus]|uniref:group II intron maturase-specific domain-containing protein n=1 Tax=Dissulfuribacter thermophilus TaxID=1156395 RepID=UPI003CC5216E